MSITRDRYGLVYFNKLPDEAKKVESVWELVVIDPDEFWYYRMREGYVLVYSTWLKRYELYAINENMRDFEIEPLIKQGRVYFLPSRCISNDKKTNTYDRPTNSSYESEGYLPSERSTVEDKD